MTDEEKNIREEIVNQAKKLRGTPFSHRGRTRFGIDCMGLVLLSYRRAGFSLPDGDGKIYGLNWFWFVKDERYLNGLLNYFNIVSSPEIGDLVMFRCYNKKITHGGIYLGNKNFIHARAGRSVTIDSLNHKYWQNRFVYYMRIKDLCSFEEL